MSDCCQIKKVALVNVYENKNEVKAYGYMVGDKNIAMVEVNFIHKFGEADLSIHNLKWYIRDSNNRIYEGLTPITDNKAEFLIPNEVFEASKTMKIQLTIVSKDGTQALNLQQFLELVVKNKI